MKRLFVIALLVVGTATFAQGKKRDHSKKDMQEIERMTPEQRTQLQLKKMTLDLDLTASQQKNIEKVLTEQSKKREAKWAEIKDIKKEDRKKPTADERYNMANQILDEQIAVKEKMKKILNEKQFEKWEKMHSDKKDRMGHKMHSKRDGKRAERRSQK